MPRRCPFNPKRFCGRPVADCFECDIRKKVQHSLVAEPPEPVRVEIKAELLKRELTCPYCLFTGSVSKFQIRNKSGKISEKRFKCPDCGEVMRRDTLFKDMSIEEFAVWIFDTQAWGRVSFSKFKQRLKDMGISRQFWDAYKKHKAEMLGSTESYEDYIMRKQKEEYDEQQAYTDMHAD